MEHLINFPIEAHELKNKRRHVDRDVPLLCFFYHRGLAVGYDVVITMSEHDVLGTVTMCQVIDDDLFKCEISFMDKKEAFKVRMLEQAAHIFEYQEKNPHMTLEEAANKWIELNGAFFPET